jgi:cation:H+ antiporter
MVWGLADYTVALTVVGIAVATGVVWVGGRVIEENIERLTDRYAISPGTTDAIVLPAASSAPELVTVLVAGAWGAFSIGVGAVLGSAVFNVLVIPAFVGIAAPGAVGSDRTALYMELLWYLVSIVAVTLAVALAVVYVPVDGAGLSGRLPAAFGVLLLGLYALHVMIQRRAPTGPPEALRTDGTGAQTWRLWAGAVGGLLTLVAGIVALVWAVRSLSATSGVSGFLMGSTYLAAATSIPDLLVLIRTRAGGQSGAGLTHVLGSNTFDLLVALPVGVLAVTALPAVAPVVSLGTVGPTMAALAAATVLLFATLRTDLELTTAESYGLLAAYGLLVAVALAEMVGLTTVLRGV